MNDLKLINGDLAIENGDFVIEDSVLQDCILIMQSRPGDWKNDAIIGADIEKEMYEDEGLRGFQNRLKRHLSRDGKTLKSLSLTEDGKLQIDVV